LGDLLSCLDPAENIQSLGARALVLRGFARREAPALMAAVMETPARRRSAIW